MEHDFHQAGRIALTQILHRELLHGSNEWGDAGNGLPAIEIGLPLIEARVRIQCRHQYQGKHAGNEGQQGHIGKVRELQEHVSLVNGELKHPVGGPEPYQRNSALHHDALDDVSMNMVAKLVREHSFDFIFAVVLQQGVCKDDAPRIA